MWKEGRMRMKRAERRLDRHRSRRLGVRFMGSFCSLQEVITVPSVSPVLA
jgi:hypothetical protein